MVFSDRFTSSVWKKTINEFPYPAVFLCKIWNSFFLHNWFSDLKFFISDLDKNLQISDLKFGSEKENFRSEITLKIQNDFRHHEAKLCILCIVSGIHKKDAPFVLLLFFTFLRSFRQNFNMFKDLSLESRNIPTQNCAPIQITVWSRNDCVKKFSKTVRRPITFLICIRKLSVSNVYLMLGETYFGSLQLRLCWISASS